MSNQRVKKIKCIGSYEDFLQEMENAGTTFDIEDIRQKTSYEARHRFCKYEGYVGEEYDSMAANEEIPDIEYATSVSIDIRSNGFSKEEVNHALFKTFKALERLGNKDDEKNFNIYITQREGLR